VDICPTLLYNLLVYIHRYLYIGQKTGCNKSIMDD
jgi:hypothetical protein